MLWPYDWDVYGGPYRRLTAPPIPIHASALPATISELARRTCFRHLCFAEREALSEGDVKVCTEGLRAHPR